MKNKMFKIAAVLLVLTLASTCIIGTTFAKYVTGDQASDTARVAKWGISVSTSGTLFGEAYEDEIVQNTGSTLYVQTSSNGTKVVAPGTKNSVGFQVAIKGTPEVAYDVSANKNGQTIEDVFLKKGSYGVMVQVPDASVNHATNFGGAVSYYKSSDATNFTKVTAYAALGTGEHYYRLVDTVDFSSGSDYYPIAWSVAESGLPAIATTSNLNTIVESMITNLSALSGKANASINVSYTLTWEWAFDGTNDAKDTILGNLAQSVEGQVVVKLTSATAATTLTDGTDYNLEVVFGLGVTVTQVDKAPTP